MPDYVTIPLADDEELKTVTNHLEYFRFCEDKEGIVFVSSDGETWFKTAMNAAGVSKMYRDRRKHAHGERKRKRRKKINKTPLKNEFRLLQFKK